MGHEDIRERGFKDRTSLADAREALRERSTPLGSRSRVSLAAAVGRVSATDVTATRDIPHYDRAAMDGWAVRASDTHGASDRSPIRFQPGDSVGRKTAVSVNTGEELPSGADAVVMKEHAQRSDGGLDIFRAVAVGENVGECGEDIRSGQPIIEAGSWIRHSDVALAKAAGRTDIAVAEKPHVAVIPTGDELVQADPDPGEIIETNGLSVSTLVDRWGGRATYHDVVPDQRSALRSALGDAREHDVIVTTGGSSVGERDLVPELVDELGEIDVHGVALKPGHPVALGAIGGTPVIVLPGYPVACLVNAVQFLRPAIGWVLGADPYPLVRTEGRLGGKLRSEPGHWTFARVRIEDDGDEPVIHPVRASGAGILSSVTAADGWVAVEPEHEGFPVGETVTVERWEWPP